MAEIIVLWFCAVGFIITMYLAERIGDKLGLSAETYGFFMLLCFANSLTVWILIGMWMFGEIG